MPKLRLEVSGVERNIIRAAAAIAGEKSMHAFCRRVVLDAAHKVIVDSGSLVIIEGHFTKKSTFASKVIESPGGALSGAFTPASDATSVDHSQESEGENTAS